MQYYAPPKNESVVMPPHDMNDRLASALEVQFILKSHADQSAVFYMHYIDQ